MSAANPGPWSLTAVASLVRTNLINISYSISTMLCDVSIYVFFLGMMWMAAANPGPSPPLRHWCEQGDQLPFYSWTSHDGVNVGVHEATDDHYTITSEFVKRPGGEHGGDWTTRLSVRPKVLIVLLIFQPTQTKKIPGVHFHGNDGHLGF